MRSLLVLIGLLLGSHAYGADVDALMRAGRVSEAFPASQAEARANPSDLDAQERMIDLALSLGVPILVEPELMARASAKPDDPASWYLLGRLALEAKVAMGHYTHALQLDPGYARAMMGVAAVERAQGRLTEAELAYRQALARDPSLAEAWAGLQATLVQRGDLDGARKEAERAIVALPDEPDAYLALATLAPERADAVLAEGVKHVPDEPRLHTAVARARLDAGDGKGAEAAARRADRIAPGMPEAGYLRLVAASMADRALDADGWQALRRAQVAQGFEAKEAFDTLVARYPQSALPWLGRGKVKLALGDAAGATEDLKMAITLAPGEGEVQATWGLHLLRLGRAADARPWLDQAAAARPNDVVLAVARAEVAQAEGQGALARSLILEAARRHPYDGRPVLAATRILHAQGDPESAYQLLRQSLERVQDPRLIVLLAASARDAGRVEEAATLLEGLAEVTGSQRARDLAVELRRSAAGP